MTLVKPHLTSAYVLRHVSRDEIYQAFPPAFRTASDKSWAWRPGNEANILRVRAIPTYRVYRLYDSALIKIHEVFKVASM